MTLRRLLLVVLLLAVSVAAGGFATLATFAGSERSVAIGAHTARISPTFDSYATFDFGPLLPAARVPVEDHPFGIGVFIDVRDTATTDLEDLLLQNAVIASQPQGEIDKVAAEVSAMFTDAVLRGVGVGLLTALALASVGRMIGRERWLELEHRVLGHRRRTMAYLVGGLAVVLVGAWLVRIPTAPDRTPTYSADAWIPLTEAFGEIPADIPELQQVEVPANAATRASAAIVEGLVETYRTSVRFYGAMRETAAQVELRRPEPGESTALVVTDRHDNIGMDPVAEVIARAAGASYVFNLGDDTSTGGSWEAFSYDSLASTFADYEIVAVAGNHDTGPFAVEAMRERGFTVLDGEPVDIGSIRMLGESDPRSSGLTAGYTGDEEDTIAAIREQDERLTQAACADGGVDTVLVHAQSSARRLAESGCVRLILSGHLHRQVGPTAVGQDTVTLTTASTGGAVYAFALGSKLRRPAQVAVVTYRDGVSVGVQLVDFDPGGEVTAQDYVELDDVLAQPA